MTNPSENRDIGNPNKSPQTFYKVEFIKIFDSSQAVDLFLEIAIKKLPNRTDIQLFVISEKEIINQNTTNFELRFNIVMHNISFNNSYHNDLLLRTIKPVINQAYIESCQSNKLDNQSSQPSHPNKATISWGKKIQKTITDQYFIALFPFIGVILFLIFVMFTGNSNQENLNPSPPTKQSQ